MCQHEFLRLLLLVWLGLAPVAFFVLLFVPAPYGRYTRSRFGPPVSRRLSWVVMELPGCLIFVALLALSERPMAAAALVFFVLWLTHYLHRTVIFPFQMRGRVKAMTLTGAVLGVVFTGVNAWLNGCHLFGSAACYPGAWVSDPRFVAGVTLFVCGFAINRHSDAVLLRLREPGQLGYRVPRGPLFDLVSCPNYLGELVQWSGWALATWSLPGVAMAVWTAANLVPRALAHHHWYKREFADYPTRRKAIIPLVL